MSDSNITVSVDTQLTGEIEVRMDKYIIQRNTACALFLSMYGREQEVRAFAAAFIEGYQISFCDIPRNFNRSDATSYSLIQKQITLSNGQKFFHEIIYPKDLIKNNVLIISNSKKQMEEQLWNSVELKFKNVPIPSFAKESIKKLVRKDICYADDKSTKYFEYHNFPELQTFGMGDYHVAYSKIITSHISDNTLKKDIQSLAGLSSKEVA